MQSYMEQLSLDAQRICFQNAIIDLSIPFSFVLEGILSASTLSHSIGTLQI